MLLFVFLYIPDEFIFVDVFCICNNNEGFFNFTRLLIVTILSCDKVNFVFKALYLKAICFLTVSSGEFTKSKDNNSSDKKV